MRLTERISAGVVAALLLMLSTPESHAAEIKVLSGTGPRAAIREFVAQFERATGHKVAIRFDVNAEVKRKIEGGETFDATVSIRRCSTS